MSAIDPGSFDPSELRMVADKVKQLVLDYGPAIVVRYILDEIKSDKPIQKEDECELVNSLQTGDIEEAVKIIEKYDDSGKLKRRLKKLCQDLDNCDVSQTELSAYRD